jgi:phosphatidylserine decarboxylase
MLFKEGKKELLFLVVFYIYSQNSKYSIILFLLLLYFFRSPKAHFKCINTEILSPTYGTVQKITKYDNQISVSIILNLNDVHTQYVPYSGTTMYLKHVKGTFNPLYLISFEKTDNNERFYTQIKTDFGNITIIQFAGMIARRIVNNLKINQNVKKGEILGMIKFSSRVDILLPKHCAINVRVGDYVYGGKTIIACV